MRVNGSYSGSEPTTDLSVKLTPGDIAKIEFALRTADFEEHLTDVGADGDTTTALIKAFDELLEKLDIVGLE